MLGKVTSSAPDLRTVTAPRPVSRRNCGPPLFPRIVAPRLLSSTVSGAPKSLCASPRSVDAFKSNFAPGGTARSISPERVWTSIFGIVLPGRSVTSPRSSVRSSDCVKSDMLTSRDRALSRIGPIKLSPVNSPNAMCTWPGTFSQLTVICGSS